MTPGSVMPCLTYNVRINDGLNFYTLFKDIFIHRLYHFNANNPRPLILDCGSNIGMSILYFKHIYPQARIIGFEPDPAIFPYLNENVSRNHLQDVQLVQTAVTSREGSLTFYSDGKYGSCLAQHHSGSIPASWKSYEVPCVRLRDYLNNSVDFVKMNIEGAEWEVIHDSRDKLHNIREIIIEYHHFPEMPRTLHKILETLHEQGFEYLIHDFDIETNPHTKPPFTLTGESQYFLLIYAKQKY